jgi:hypothetical protein
MNDFLATLPVVLIFVVLAQQVLRDFPAGERSLLWLSFFAHQVGSVCHILIMDLYYGYGDMFAYARRGRLIADHLRGDFFGLAPELIKVILQVADATQLPFEMSGSNTGSMQAIASFAMFFFNDSLYSACAAIAGLAFLSKLALYVAVRRELADVPYRGLLISCMLVPSVVFWSSALLKEPIAMIGLCAVVYGWQRFMSGERGLRVWPIIAVGSSMVILVKGYIFPVLGIGMALWFLLRSLNARRGGGIKLWHVAAAAGLVSLALIGTAWLLPEFALDSVEEEVAKQQVVGERVRGGSTYSLGAAAGDSASQLVLAPLGLLTALFRPLLFEAANVLSLITALEMSVFIILTGIVLYRRKIGGTIRETLRRPFLGFCAAFVVVFGTGVGLATTNLGSLARYRMPLVPFFGVLLVTLAERSKQREPSADTSKVNGD